MMFTFLILSVTELDINTNFNLIFNEQNITAVILHILFKLVFQVFSLTKYVKVEVDFPELAR
jgi:hypothetical protein